MPQYPCNAKKLEDEVTGKKRWELTNVYQNIDTCPTCHRRGLLTVKTHTYQYEVKLTPYRCKRARHFWPVQHIWKQCGQPGLRWRPTGKARYETIRECGHNKTNEVP